MKLSNEKRSSFLVLDEDRYNSSSDEENVSLSISPSYDNHLQWRQRMNLMTWRTKTNNEESCNNEDEEETES